MTRPKIHRIEQLITRVTLWLLTFFSFVASAAILILLPHGSESANVARVIAPMAIFGACVAAVVLARWGRARLGVGLVVAVAYLTIVNYVVVSRLGIHTHAFALLAILVVVASLLIGHREGLMVAAITVATAVVLYLLERFGGGVDPRAVGAIPATNILIVYCILFSALGGVLYAFSRAFREILHATEDQEQRFRQLFDVAPLGYVIHRAGRILMINRAAATATGFGVAEDMLGMDIFRFVPAEQGEGVRQHLASAASVGPGVNVSAEFRVNLAGGRVRQFEITTTPIVLADGPALFTMMRDVTRAREASAALAAAKEQAESSSRAKSQFLANMSHEIRTPLNGVLGMADLLRGTPLSAEQRRYCEAIAASGRSLRDLLGSVLDLAKIEAGKMGLEREEFDLSRLVADLVSIYRELAGARKNEFVALVDLPGNSRYCGDSLRVRQVLGNLLGNAVKFTAGGRVEFGAKVLEPRSGDPRTWLLFTVRDSGIGMNAETVAKLFQPFTQADNSTTRQYGGTGLGLAIARNLVELMGGVLEVDSSPGAGSTSACGCPSRRRGPRPREGNRAHPMLTQPQDPFRCSLSRTTTSTRKWRAPCSNRPGTACRLRATVPKDCANGRADGSTACSWTARCRSWTATTQPASSARARPNAEAGACGSLRLPRAPWQGTGNAALPPAWTIFWSNRSSRLPCSRSWRGTGRAPSPNRFGRPVRRPSTRQRSPAC